MLRAATCAGAAGGGGRADGDLQHGAARRQRPRRKQPVAAAARARRGERQRAVARVDDPVATAAAARRIADDADPVAAVDVERGVAFRARELVVRPAVQRLAEPPAQSFTTCDGAMSCLRESSFQY